MLYVCKDELLETGALKRQEANGSGPRREDEMIRGKGAESNSSSKMVRHAIETICGN